MCPCRAEREQARVQQQSISSKLFNLDGSDETGCPVYTPAPQLQQVCQVVDGFIYIANAEPGRGLIKLGSFYFLFFVADIVNKRKGIYLKQIFPTTGDGASEAAHIRAVLRSGRETSPRPLLVLSCISREEPETAKSANLQNVTRNLARRRTSCVDIAKRLELPKTINPWMVRVSLLSCISVNQAMTSDLFITASILGAGRSCRIIGWTS